ncbi:M23 family metallopeptidase [Desulfotomaculum nigrificans]|uniref:M23 family metallopeptidase n=1 Tax=Desulfotomaculum nigrificans TaxID=1565 RepID=UPI0001FAE8AB|nr:M23 family metallopeptidase [Desulfotomaculum nigrificans]
MQVKEKLISLKGWLDKQPAVIKRGLAGLLAVVLVLGAISVAKANSACAVMLDGREVAVVQNQSVAEGVVSSLTKEQQSKAANVKPLQKITYKRVNGSDRVISEQELKELLAKKLTFEATAVGIKVNGGLKLAVKDRPTAEQVLEELKRTYQVDSSYKVTFAQKVDLVDLPLPANKIMSKEQALKKLKGESDKPRFYVVKEGDTIWDIAEAFNISAEDLQAANPDFVPERMQIGQKLKMVGVAEPILDVVATTEKTIKEQTELPQQVRKNPNLPYGKSKVVQVGEKGLKEVTYRIVAVNGLETERQVLGVKVIKEAKPQIIERSSRTMVASRGLSRPSGAILSPFGTRGGRMHTGVDLAGAYGAPIRAAQAGKVIRAGWYGGYGNCVDISHGNGVVTRYAHMSSIGVMVGQTVSKGQVIGRIGSTGRSTGPHLHFEVIVNGVPRNPLAYL